MMLPSVLRLWRSRNNVCEYASWHVKALTTGPRLELNQGTDRYMIFAEVNYAQDR